MSSRRSLYRSNRSHTSLYGPRTDTTVSHWKLDFLTINTTRDEESPSETPQKTNSFQVKTWIQTSSDEFKHLDDGVENDALPFIQHTHAESDLGIGAHDASEPPPEASNANIGFIPTDSGPSRQTEESGASTSVLATPAEPTSGEVTSVEGITTGNTSAVGSPSAAAEGAAVRELPADTADTAAAASATATEVPPAERAPVEATPGASGDDQAPPSINGSGSEARPEQNDVPMPDAE